MKQNYIYDRLREVKVIDTHEHLWDETYRFDNPGDWTGLFFHYGITALRMAGMGDGEIRDFYSPETEHQRKWEIFAKYFDAAGNTAYIKSVLIAIRDIYGIDRIDSDSMLELTSRIKEAVKPGFNRKIIRDMAGIDYCMVNSFDCDAGGNRYPARFWGDTELFRPDLYVDMFIYPSAYALISKETGEDCSTLSGWIKAIDRYFEKHAGSCCSIKVAIAYAGSLDFNPSATFGQADGVYARHLKSPLAYKEAKPLVDFLLFHIVKKAAEYNMPLKFHTGTFSFYDNVNFNTIEGNVRHISNLAMAHPECRFIAMHMAYPYQDELVVAIRQVTNLYAEMSWTWIVDTESACIFVKKALCAAPATKVLGFGGDYSFVENTYGHLEIARRALSGALSDLVENGYFNPDEAVRAGQHLLRGSAEKLYKR